MRVVLDANQFVSAVLVPVGHPAQILRAWREGRFELALSQSIVAEIHRVLLYPRLRKKHGWSEEQIDAFLKGLTKTATITLEQLSVRVVDDDPADDKYLACALEADASYIVTGDRHLQHLGMYQGVKIVSPAVFLQILEAGI
jgi:putative PIN family toxin of toxin-antitoxin system